jgi:hypothetical protein
MNLGLDNNIQLSIVIIKSQHWDSGKNLKDHGNDIYFNSDTDIPLHDDIYLFLTDCNLCVSTRKTEPRLSY